ncbi:MAG: thermonuclease family protein [Clostridiales Family XIII bacterium]|jgi:micrococcal nuclease|nr:thermonuclease family protein [Clostridiales Family XIII bacterium]
MRKILKILFYIFTLCLFLSTGTLSIFAESGITGKVYEVIDGDTFYLKYNKKLVKVRLLGIDAPESKSSKIYQNGKLGEKSAKYLSKILKNKKVKVKFDKQKYDAYGRLLGYVYKGKTFINERQLKKGFALTLFYEPNIKYKKKFIKLEKNAKDKAIGIWKGISFKKNRKNFKYIASKSSMKLHKLSCRYAKNIPAKNKIYFKNKDFAKAYKCILCKICLE